MPVKERGILYKGEMVQAVLRDVDPKTQTRRVIKRDTSQADEYIFHASGTSQAGNDWRFKRRMINGNSIDVSGWFKCPYGKPGDRLWVREKWADLRGMGFGNNPITSKPFEVAYGADTEPGSDGDRARLDYGVKWRPSIFMPRWASRIDLEILSIRVERLQDISHEDAKAEGAPEPVTEMGLTQGDWRGSFRALWDSINAAPKPCYGKVDGKKVITHYISYPWEDIQETRTHRGKPWHVIGNPWNWVIEFKLVEGA